MDRPARSTNAALRVLIVDDEAPARTLLREYLEGVPNVDVAGECKDGFEAVKAVAELDPDLLLLDIQMPKLDGFEVLELIEREIPVVFVTAYDHYSIRAFDVHAVDYLLKPYTKERLLDAIDRARDRVARLRAAPKAGVGPRAGHRHAEGSNSDETRRGTPALPETATARAVRRERAPLDRILVRDGSRVFVVPVESVHYIEAQDDYVCIVTKDQRLLKQQTLSELEASLDPRRFVRIHRSYLVNVVCLTKIEAVTKDSRAAVLKSGVELPVSRQGYDRLRRLL
jgi:two-component system LytT family response regulator